MSNSDNYSSSESSKESSRSEQEEMEVLSGNFQPYQDEPVGQSSDEEEDNEADKDGLTPAVLESRFDRQVPVESW